MGTATLAIVFAVAALLSGFYIVPKRVGVWPSRIFRAIAGIAQTACHVVAQAAIAMVCAWAFSTLTGWRLPLCMLVVGVVGGIVGSIIFAAFLFAVFTLFGWNSTEAFSCFRYSGYKNFLRIHVTETAVTVYPIGIDETCHQWVYDREPASAEASWLKPSTGSIEMRLIEPEFTILAPPQTGAPG
jgi:MFS family permease